MKEQVLYDYFQNKVDTKFLGDALTECRESMGTSFSLDLEDIDSESPLIVNRTHAIKLCNDVVNGGLSFENLNSIAFIVSYSKGFVVDPKDDIADRFFDDWTETTAGFVWNLPNMTKWKELLEFGVDTFEDADLKKWWENS